MLGFCGGGGRGLSLSRGNFAAGLIEFGAHLIAYFQLILKMVAGPLADFLDLLAGQLQNRLSNFLNRAHIVTLSDEVRIGKSLFTEFGSRGYRVTG